MTRRAMGKATFITIQDMSGKIQLYVARDNLPEGVYKDDVGTWDLGDIVGIKGTLFKTKLMNSPLKLRKFNFNQSTSPITRQIPWFNRPRSSLSPTLFRFNF